MGMFRDYLAARRQLARDEAMYDGFGWACAEILVRGATPSDVRAKASGNHPFDIGAANAVGLLVRRGLVEDSEDQ